MCIIIWIENWESPENLITLLENEMISYVNEMDTFFVTGQAISLLWHDKQTEN